MEELDVRVTRHTEQIKTIFTEIKEIKDISKNISELSIATHDLAASVKTMNSDIRGLRRDVDDIKSRPAKRWEGLVDKILLAVVTGVVGFLLASAGIG